MATVRIGVAGCGMAGQKHVDAFSSLGSIAKVVGVCDNDLELARRIGSKYQVAVFSDYLELLESGIDLFVIATPHVTHHQLAIDGLHNGTSLLVEKPLASNLRQAKEIAALATEKNLKCAVGFVHRHRTEMQDAYRHLRNFDCGEIVYMTDTFWLSGGEKLPEWLWKGSEGGLGVLGYSAIHRIDWQGWLADSRVASVYANTNMSGLYEGSIHGVVVNLMFESGAIGTVVGYQPNVNVESPFINTIISGSEGLMSIKLGKNLEVRTVNASYVKSVVQDNQFVAQALDVVNSIIDDREPCSSAYDGVHSASIVEAIIQSAKDDARIDVMK
tara:strand:+ start:76 stop:1062 length:987 start_codon:yes stop_codon:yes gene_type:complete